MIKMIAMDLDDTLLKTDKTISTFTIETLRKCKERGIKIVYATARGEGAKEFLPKNLFDGEIILNGAIGVVENKIIYRRLIQGEIAKKLLIACDKEGFKVAAIKNGRHYSNFNVMQEWEYLKDYEIADFSKFDMEVEKIYFPIQQKEEVLFIKPHISEHLYMTVSRDNLAQIMNIEATKGRAVSHLASQWSIEMSEVVAFGDDTNDIDLLQAVGVGVVMGNALEEVKIHGDAITDTNDRDGVARWLIDNL